MGTYRGKSRKSKAEAHGRKTGFAYLDIKSEQYERERGKTSILKNKVLEKKSQIRKLEKQVESLEQELQKLQSTVRVQRNLIEELMEKG